MYKYGISIGETAVEIYRSNAGSIQDLHDIGCTAFFYNADDAHSCGCYEAVEKQLTYDPKIKAI